MQQIALLQLALRETVRISIVIRNLQGLSSLLRTGVPALVTCIRMFVDTPINHINLNLT